MSYETVIFEVENRVASITLNRPERLNALNQKMKDELRECWDRIKRDPEIWAVIMTGTGRAFSSGADVESLATGGFAKPDRWRELCIHEGIRDLPTPRRMHVYKPVICAVNGLVAGVSLDFVTESDIPICGEKATFFDPHVSVGRVSSHEMVNMARRVPVSVCLRMALLGNHDRMDAKRAYQVGLVTEVVPDDQLMARARELAGMLLENPPQALWGTKMALLRGLGLPIEPAEDIAIGFSAFVEQSEDIGGSESNVELNKKPLRS